MEKAKKKSDSTAWEAAKRYVNQQLETMKKFGSAPALSQEKYNALVQKVVDATK